VGRKVHPARGASRRRRCRRLPPFARSPPAKRDGRPPARTRTAVRPATD
jgi:hypothetical protein